MPNCRPHAMCLLRCEQVLAHAGHDAPAKGGVEVLELEDVTRLTFTGLLPSCSAMEAVQAAR